MHGSVSVRAASTATYTLQIHPAWRTKASAPPTPAVEVKELPPRSGTRTAVTLAPASSAAAACASSCSQSEAWRARRKWAAATRSGINFVFD